MFYNEYTDGKLTYEQYNAIMDGLMDRYRWADEEMKSTDPNSKQHTMLSNYMDALSCEAGYLQYKLQH